MGRELTKFGDAVTRTYFLQKNFDLLNKIHKFFLVIAGGRMHVRINELEFLGTYWLTQILELKVSYP